MSTPSVSAVTHVLYVVKGDGVWSPRAYSQSDAETKFALEMQNPDVIALFLFAYVGALTELRKTFIHPAYSAPTETVVAS